MTSIRQSNQSNRTSTQALQKTSKTRRNMGLALASLLFVGAGIFLSQQAHAQNYPTRPVKIIVPFATGGPADNYARFMAQRLQDSLGQTFVVDNKPGAGSVIGTDLAAKAAPDGYTLLLMSNTQTVNETLIPNKPYGLMKDFVGVAPINYSDLVLVVNPTKGLNTLADVIRVAKAQPGKLNYASSGPGTPYHMAGELFKSMAKIDLVHIPYKGTALAIPDLISGKVDVLFDSLPTGMPHVRDGRLRALGVTTLKPTALAPGIPAIADVLPGYESNTWFGFFGPKNLPPEVVSRINTVANQVLKDPEVMDKLLRFGIEPVGGTPAQFTTMLASESAKWKKIITERKITLE